MEFDLRTYHNIISENVGYRLHNITIKTRSIRVKLIFLKLRHIPCQFGPFYMTLYYSISHGATFRIQAGNFFSVDKNYPKNKKNSKEIMTFFAEKKLEKILTLTNISKFSANV